MLTIAIAIIIPISLLIYSNSRITEAKDTLRAETKTLGSELRVETKTLGGELRAEMMTLRADMNAGFGETRRMHQEVMAGIDKLDSKIEIKLLTHELEHHHQ